MDKREADLVLSVAFFYISPPPICPEYFSALRTCIHKRSTLSGRALPVENSRRVTLPGAWKLAVNWQARRRKALACQMMEYSTSDDPAHLLPGIPENALPNGPGRRLSSVAGTVYVCAIHPGQRPDAVRFRLTGFSAPFIIACGRRSHVFGF